MKKVLFIALVLAVAGIAKAQNIQLHYDLGEDRQMFTTTVEMFKPDKYGSTFFFIDLDHETDKRGVETGVSLAYWEIARSFKWNENQKFEPRIEFNNGRILNFPISNSWLIGGQYTFNNSDFSKVLTLQANYKYIVDGKANGDNLSGFQLTAVWGVHFADRKFSFLGFADFWKQDSFGGEYVFLTEPQLWYNICDKFSLGTEIELSSNFAKDEFVINPTIAAKWTF